MVQDQHAQLVTTAQQRQAGQHHAPLAPTVNTLVVMMTQTAQHAQVATTAQNLH